MKHNRIYLPVLVFISMLLLPGRAAAQSDAEINGSIQFNFSLPGARSLGMGGAFSGLADDATAAYTNPAGITILQKQEVGFEARRFDYTHVYTDRGHAFGNPTGTGIDTISGLDSKESSNDVTGLSFISYVYPHDRFAIAVYRHELANFEADTKSFGAFLGTGSNLTRLFPAVSKMDLDIVNYGVSAAYRFGGGFSLGLGVSYYDFSMSSLTRRFDVRGSGTSGPGDFYGPPDYSAGNLVNYQEQEGDDTDTGVNVGIVWRPNGKLGFGAVYRQGPSFHLNVRNVGADGTVFVDTEASFHVPDVYSVGASYRPLDALTLSAEVRRVKYSQLTGGLVDLFHSTDPTRAELDRFNADDATEIHVGLEYLFLGMTNPIAVRVGSWWDPDHKIVFDGQDNAARAMFREGSDELHYTAGVGVVFGDHFQLDAAYDTSDLIDTASLSAVARF